MDRHSGHVELVAPRSIGPAGARSGYRLRTSVERGSGLRGCGRLTLSSTSSKSREKSHAVTHVAGRVSVGNMFVWLGSLGAGRTLGQSAPPWMDPGLYPALIGGAVACVLLCLIVSFLQRSKLRAEGLVELLHSSEQRFRTLAASSPVGIFQFDFEGRCVYANARFREILGFDEEDPVDPGWRQSVHPEDRDDTEAAWLGAACGMSAPPVHFRVGEGSGQRWAESLAVTLRDDDGDIAGCVGTVEDITERRRIEAQLTHQALHDPLTGLPNRTLFVDRVEMALARTRRGEGMAAVLFIDLDRFKLINDSLGHECGDELLMAIAERLGGVLRASDSIGRLGGDEFAVLCEVDAAPAAMRIAEHIATAVEAPVDLQSGQVVVSASIGIALSHGSPSATSLLENAGRGDVPGQGTRQGPHRDLRREHAHPHAAPPPGRERPARGNRAGTTRRLLPAHSAARRRPNHSGRGARTLARPRPRARAARRLHPGRRGDRADRAARGLGAARSLPPRPRSYNPTTGR